jgi:hypothetical protein
MGTYDDDGMTAYASAHLTQVTRQRDEAVRNLQSFISKMDSALGGSGFAATEVVLEKAAVILRERDAYRKAKAENDERFMLERDEARKQADELQAARYAYASEFPPNAEGDPDVGSIHANIRALKRRAAALTEAAHFSRLALNEATKPGEKLSPLMEQAFSSLHDVLDGTVPKEDG